MWRLTMFLLCLIAAVSGTPLRQAEAANDFARSIGESGKVTSRNGRWGRRRRQGSIHPEGRRRYAIASGNDSAGDGGRSLHAASPCLIPSEFGDRCRADRGTASGRLCPTVMPGSNASCFERVGETLDRCRP